MHNAWQVSILNSLGQVSSNGPSALILPYPTHISLPTLSKHTPSISPLFYNYIHSPPATFPIQMSVYQPCPLPPIFAFLGPFCAIPLLPTPSPTIIYLFPLFPKAFYPCLIHPTPLLLPAPCPHFRFFLSDLWSLFCMYFCSILSTHIHT